MSKRFRSIAILGIIGAVLAFLMVPAVLEMISQAFQRQGSPCAVDACCYGACPKPKAFDVQYACALECNFGAETRLIFGLGAKHNLAVVRGVESTEYLGLRNDKNNSRCFTFFMRCVGGPNGCGMNNTLVGGEMPESPAQKSAIQSEEPWFKMFIRVQIKGLKYEIYPINIQTVTPQGEYMLQLVSLVQDAGCDVNSSWTEYATKNLTMVVKGNPAVP